MPNWSCNTIIIEGTEEAVATFAKTLRTPDEQGEIQDFSFHQTIPRPSNRDDNWYEYNVNSWGTKWDASEPTIIEESPEKIVIQCETAWSPPTEWASKVAQKIKGLKITVAFCEIGMHFYGVDVYEGKRSIKIFNKMDDEVDFDKAPEGSTEEEIDEWESEPAGPLKVFMEKYSIRHTGG